MQTGSYCHCNHLCECHCNYQSCNQHCFCKCRSSRKVDLHGLRPIIATCLSRIARLKGPFSKNVKVWKARLSTEEVWCLSWRLADDLHVCFEKKVELQSLYTACKTTSRRNCSCAMNRTRYMTMSRVFRIWLVQFKRTGLEPLEIMRCRQQWSTVGALFPTLWCRKLFIWREKHFAVPTNL